jgi:hypothetical protein
MTQTAEQDHEHLPLPGSAYQEDKSLPADIQLPWDYPVQALCSCGARIRCRTYVSHWEAA